MASGLICLAMCACLAVQLVSALRHLGLSPRVECPTRLLANHASSAATVESLPKKVLVGLVHQVPMSEDKDALVKSCLDALIDASDPLNGVGAGALRNGDNSMLLGDWSTVYTSQPILRMQCTLNELATAKKETPQAKSALLSIHSVRQRIQRLPSASPTEVQQKPPHQFIYDNIVQFSFNDRPEVEGLLSTRGWASCSPLDPCRLMVIFYAQECSALEAKYSDVFGSLSGDWPAFQQMNEEMHSYSDVCYLDADLRVMRGARGSLYILQKVE